MDERQILRRMRSADLLLPLNIRGMARIEHGRIEVRVLSAVKDSVPMTREAALLLSDHLRDLAEQLDSDGSA